MLSKKTKYAIRALIALGEQFGGDSMNILSISQKEKIPKKFLEQILLEMRNAGFLYSKKGAGGGYSLLKNPEEINLVQVMRLTGGPIAQLNLIQPHGTGTRHHGDVQAQHGGRNAMSRAGLAPHRPQTQAAQVGKDQTRHAVGDQALISRPELARHHQGEISQPGQSKRPPGTRTRMTCVQATACHERAHGRDAQHHGEHVQTGPKRRMHGRQQNGRTGVHHASGREGGGPPTQPPFRPTMSKPQEYHCYKQLHQTGSNREAF